MVSLRDPGAGAGPLGQVVALDDRHPLDVAGQGLCGGETRDPGADHDGVGRDRRAAARRCGGAAAVEHRGDFASAARHRRVAPARSGAV